MESKDPSASDSKKTATPHSTTSPRPKTSHSKTPQHPLFAAVRAMQVPYPCGNCVECKMRRQAPCGDCAICSYNKTVPATERLRCNANACVMLSEADRRRYLFAVEQRLRRMVACTQLADANAQLAAAAPVKEGAAGSVGIASITGGIVGATPSSRLASARDATRSAAVAALCSLSGDVSRIGAVPPRHYTHRSRLMRRTEELCMTIAETRVVCDDDTPPAFHGSVQNVLRELDGVYGRLAPDTTAVDAASRLRARMRNFAARAIAGFVGEFARDLVSARRVRELEAAARSALDAASAPSLTIDETTSAPALVSAAMGPKPAEPKPTEAPPSAPVTQVATTLEAVSSPAPPVPSALSSPEEPTCAPPSLLLPPASPSLGVEFAPSMFFGGEPTLDSDPAVVDPWTLLFN